MRDLNGRAYALVATVKAGDKLETDGDFTCMSKGKIVEVGIDDRGLFIPCQKGHHYLSGQVKIDKLGPQYYVGLYPVVPAETA